LRDASGAVVDSQASGTVGSYTAYDCSTPYFIVNTTNPSWSTVLPASAMPKVTVITSRLSGAVVPSAAAFFDASDALSSGLGPYINGKQPNFMNQCALRFLNVRTRTVWSVGTKSYYSAVITQESLPLL
jgi:hypothetical protein